MLIDVQVEFGDAFGIQKHLQCVKKALHAKIPSCVDVYTKLVTFDVFTLLFMHNRCGNCDATSMR